MYDATHKDRHSRYTRLKRSHALLKAGVLGALLAPALVYLTSGLASLS